MARNIHNYKSLPEFTKEYYSNSKYSEPWTSHVQRESRFDGYVVNYNRNGQMIPPSKIWLDDFPDGTDEGYSSYEQDYMEYKYGYESIEDYFDVYLGDGLWEEMGANCWEYVTNMEFDGVVYYLYELHVPLDDNSYYGLMPVTYTIDELESLSVYNNHSNRFQPFDYVLDHDCETVYQEPEHLGLPGDRYVLVKVEP